MLSKKNRTQKTLFIPGDISDYIPETHILKQVDKILDLKWLDSEVADCYCHTNGRPGINPESAVRLMLAGFFHGIIHDRKLIREAQVNIAIRWFAGYDLCDKLPHHSSLTRIRQRWGEERFRKIFIKTVESCVNAGLVDGDTVHIDATLIRADVSWESLVTKHVDTVIKNNDDSENDDTNAPKPRGRRPKKQKKKKISKTDPDATMTTSKHSFHMEPYYKQHTSVDDKFNVVLDVSVTTGETNEGSKLLETIDRIEKTTEIPITTVTADKSYSHSKNYQKLEEKEIQAIIPSYRVNPKPKTIPKCRFKYDAKHDIVKCPTKQKLTRKSKVHNGWKYSCSAKICQACKLKSRCLSKTSKSRPIIIVDGYTALQRARRKKLKGWDKEWKTLYERHKWKVEGAHGEAKTQHGLKRAIRRGLSNVAIQVYLTAATMNLKRLATFLLFYLYKIRLNKAIFSIKKPLFTKNLLIKNKIIKCA